MKKTKSIIHKKNTSNKITYYIILAVSTFAITILLLMFYMLIKQSMPAYKKYGFFHMYFSADFSEVGGYGIWGGLSITLITSILAIIIAIPLSLRMAIFMKYRMKKNKKILKVIVNILAGVPSVIFGIFALKSLTHFSNFLGFGISTSIFNGILTLVIMVFPTIVSMLYNQLNLTSDYLIKSSIALGNTKTYSIYKVVKKEIKGSVIVAAIIGLGRAIGETMALSIILTTSPLSNPLTNGLFDFFNSSSASLGVMIARLMYTDSADENIRSALFASGLALFLTVMFLIVGATKLSKKSNFKNINPWVNVQKIKDIKYPAQFIYWFSYGWNLLTLPFRYLRYYIFKLFDLAHIGIIYFSFWISAKIFSIGNYEGSQNNIIYIKHSQNNLNKISDYFRKALEIMSVFIIIGSIGWIIIDIFSIGLPNWTTNMWKWTYEKHIQL